MGESTAHFYQRILQCEEAAALPRRSWKLVLVKGATGEDLFAAYELLRAYEGAWIYADAILCRLREVKKPPAWTLIAWPDNWMWFPLGRRVSIYLPLADPPT